MDLGTLIGIIVGALGGIGGCLGTIFSKEKLQKKAGKILAAIFFAIMIISLIIFAISKSPSPSPQSENSLQNTGTTIYNNHSLTYDDSSNTVSLSEKEIASHNGSFNISELHNQESLGDFTQNDQSIPSSSLLTVSSQTLQYLHASILERTGIQDSITYRDQENAYTYRASISGIYYFQAADRNPETDVWVRVLNSNENEIKGNNSAVAVELKAGEKYIITVGDRGRNCDYNLKIDIE